jgi:hypothetical protein
MPLKQRNGTGYTLKLKWLARAKEPMLSVLTQVGKQLKQHAFDTLHL